MNLEWSTLRPFNGDIKHGFEELVCQLARSEFATIKSKFLRKASPDAGVEAFCILENKDEYGWQTKFFTSVGSVQWKDLESSFKQAFVKHPNLVRYYVCLPLDREDPRIDKKQWFMDKWNTKVIEWQGFAKANKREIEFIYWGSFEIFDMLSKPDNAGKSYFWFNKNEYTDEWFNYRLSESIRNLDKRYTPELNFELPIAKIFDGIARDEDFKRQFDYYYYSAKKKSKNFYFKISNNKIDESLIVINEKLALIENAYDEICFDDDGDIEFNYFVGLLNDINAEIYKIIDEFFKLNQQAKEESKLKEEKSYNNSGRHDLDIYSCRQLANSCHSLINFLSGRACQLYNNPNLMLVGEAGSGKSHLLADIANRRKSKSQFSILLLGQNFTSRENPWAQIKNILGINCEQDTFFSALDSKAESCRTRIVIFIDAINEGEGKNIWPDFLPGFISYTKKYKNLGLVYSIRASYEEIIVKRSLYKNNEIFRVMHAGFAGYEYEASKLFFENYKIKQPSIPLLHPEFSNPLFLKLFCEGLAKQNLHEIPVGYEGISQIIDNYLSGINHNIFNKSVTLQNLFIIKKVAYALAEKMSEIGSNYLGLESAFSVAKEISEKFGINNCALFFDQLVSEGLLTKNLFLAS